ncbi:MAG: formate dehydrogenase accessory sulfurtransferase FdhD [Parvularculaceae bacterium]|nr:formate dehydrogenase accessory sulfurtransferase FdhD [Parvularculaceae bacterium]
MPTVRSFGSPPPTAREISLSNGARRWNVPEETPVAFIYNGRNYAVMLATPADLADFAVGFSLAERIISDIGEIDLVEIHHGEGGVDVRLSIAEKALEKFDIRQQRRNLVGSAGCGVCGLENADVFFERLAPVVDQMVTLSNEALKRAAQELSSFQPLNASTRSVHAAAWASNDGGILLAREDVGRHNALDKLIGALAWSDIDVSSGFIVMSSRCSYEIIDKAARAGVRAVLTISAPTAFAIRKAKEANIALYALGGDEIAAVGER